MISDIYLIHRYVSVLELGWTVIAVGGLAAALANIRFSLRQLAALAAAEDSGDPELSKIALSGVRSDAIRVVQLIAVVVLGWLAFKTKTPNPAPPMPPSAWAAVACFYILTGGLALNTVLDERFRRRFHHERAANGNGAAA